MTGANLYGTRSYYNHQYPTAYTRAGYYPASTRAGLGGSPYRDDFTGRGRPAGSTSFGSSYVPFPTKIWGSTDTDDEYVNWQKAGVDTLRAAAVGAA